LSFFRPTWAILCTDRGEIWLEGALLHAKFHHRRCNDKGIGPQKLKILLTFYQISDVSIARFSRHLQSLYVVSGCVSH